MGPDPSRENNPDWIKLVLHDGYHVEIDVWCIKNHSNIEWYLGHDYPQYLINPYFLQHKNLWCHAKNPEALEEMHKMKNVHFFWHQEDFFTLTSNGFIWAYPGQQNLDNSIVLLFDKKNSIPKNCYGICTDYVYFYEFEFEKK